jgi:hypothetical protein
VELRESDRLGTRLLALNIKHEELNRKVQDSQIRLLRLEAHFNDTRLAHLLGEGDDPQSLRPEVEKARTELDSHKELLAEVVKSRQEAQVAYSTARWAEAREDLVAKGELPPLESADADSP